MTITEDNLRNNPRNDSCSSWTICVCAFIANAVSAGIAYCFGESLGSVTEEFNVTVSEASWITSVHGSAQYLAASLSSVLFLKFGFGGIVFIGSAFASIGLALATLSKDTATLTLLFGVVSGIGLGFTESAGKVICSFYFKQRRQLATGISIAGMGFGIVVVSFSTNLMDLSYGWRGLMTTCSCICPLIWPLAITTWLFPVKPGDSDAELGLEEDSKDQEKRRYKTCILHIEFFAVLMHLVLLTFTCNCLSNF